MEIAEFTSWDLVTYSLDLRRRLEIAESMIDNTEVYVNSLMELFKDAERRMGRSFQCEVFSVQAEFKVLSN